MTVKKKTKKKTTKPKKNFPTVTIREQDGTIIQPWSDVKDLKGWEWIRSAPEEVLSPDKDRRVVEATYVAVVEVPIMILGEQKGVFDTAFFQTEQNGDLYDVAKRLADRRKVRLFDRVKLHILGCCNIQDIEKINHVK